MSKLLSVDADTIYNTYKISKHEMMRKIRFRGKDYNDNWVYGWLSGPNTIHFESVNKYKWTAESVLPNTVGQFTGVQDEDGLRIYEGDIIQYVIYVQGDYIECISEVVFEGSGFVVFFEHGSRNLDSVSQKKVIGNIYDNPKNTEV